MKTDVLLADGFVRLSMEDASGDIALWLPAWWDSHGTWHLAEPLLQSDGAAVRYMTIRRWRNIIRRYNFQNAIEAYKMALRFNPNDDETRYNLVLCQRQLKKQGGGQNNQQNKQDDQQDQQKQEQQKQEQQQQKQDKQQEQQEPPMSKENAEQLLNAAMQQEKQTQQRMQEAQKQQSKRRRIEKNW